MTVLVPSLAALVPTLAVFAAGSFAATGMALAAGVNPNVAVALAFCLFAVLAAWFPDLPCWATVARWAPRATQRLAVFWGHQTGGLLGSAALVASAAAAGAWASAATAFGTGWATAGWGTRLVFGQAICALALAGFRLCLEEAEDARGSWYDTALWRAGRGAAWNRLAHAGQHVAFAGFEAGARALARVSAAGRNPALAVAVLGDDALAYLDLHAARGVLGELPERSVSAAAAIGERMERAALAWEGQQEQALRVAARAAERRGVGHAVATGAVGRGGGDAEEADAMGGLRRAAGSS